MYRYISDIVKKARKEKQLTQEELIGKIGEHQVSIRTLQRIESGDLTVTDELVNIILDYFSLDLGYRLRDAYEERIMREWLERVPEEVEINECIKSINADIMEYRTLFHGEENLYKDYHIKSLPEFFIYLPLMDINRLNQALVRVGGTIRGYFTYFLDQCEWLYEEIPDSILKKAADEKVKDIFADDQALIEKMGDKEMAEIYQEYDRFLNRKLNIDSKIVDLCKTYTEYNESKSNK